MTILASAILAVILDFHLNRPDMSSYEKVRINWQASEARLFDRNGLLIHEMRVNKNIRKLEWVELEDISEAMKKIVISSEDRRFYQHSGVDWVSVTGSILKGARRGASTITMQTASFIDSGSAGNRSRRGPIRKWRQMKAAAALEETWTKEQILEAYLNLAGYRGELAGIGAASAGMFMKEPSGLNTEEASVLCALLKGNRADHAVVAERAVRIARSSGLSCDIERIRIFTLQTLSRTYNKIKPEIMLAPHVAGMLMKNGTMSVKCTLDKHIQETALLALDRRLYELEGRNVSDGAVIVIDNASGDILAYVGSSGSRSSARHVDGVKAKRQAGSTLKPFLYELAIEKKILTPASLLEDSPLKITTPAGVYEPDNYSNEYHGIVSVRTALASSLNIPAVRALGLVGQEAFVERLGRWDYRQ
jgi:penicillin-binding protein 1C